MKRLGIALAIGVLASLATPPAIAQVPDDCNGVAVNDFRATDTDDYLTGTDVRDVIALGTGDDQYFAAEASDLLCGNEGADVLVGEDGADNLDGGAGDDVVVGMAGQDVVRGSAGKDEIRGGKGDDVLRSSAVDDVQDDLYDGPGADTVIGNPEDIWHRCLDDAGDDHSDFTGIIVPDPDC